VTVPRGSLRLRRPSIRSDREVAERLAVPAKHGAQPLRVAIASATAMMCLVALVILTASRTSLMAQLESPLADKLADAERIAYYKIPQQGSDLIPTFRLGPGDTSIKLITHIVLPKGTTYDSSADYAYGIRLELTDLDGEPQWSHELNIRTRQSKSELSEFGYRYENSFLLDDPDLEGEDGRSHGRSRELTDDRLTRVRLPEGDGDRFLRLTFVPREPSEGVEGLARAYVQRPRAIADLRELSLDPETARELVDHLTYRDWEQLSQHEREARLSRVWERLSADGQVEIDYELFSIYETPFRLQRHSKTGARRLLVTPARSLAINLLVSGESDVELELEAFGLPEQLAGLEVQRFSLDGSGQVEPTSAASLRAINVPPGVHTLVISASTPVEFTLAAAEVQKSRVWLIEADRPRRLTDDGREVLEPDERRIQVANVGAPGKLLPRWEIVGPDDSISRTFRFDIRVVHPDAETRWLESGPAPDIELCFYGGEGAVMDMQLGCERWTGAPAIASDFEGLRVGVEGPGVGVAGPGVGVTEPGVGVANLVAEGLGVGEAISDGSGAAATAWHVVSEPQTVRLVAPPLTKLIEMRAAVPDQHLIVRGYGYWPEVETVLGEPFREHVAEPTIWRYPPLDTRTWFPVRPVNYDALHDERSIADLLAQVRLQPRGDGTGTGTGAGGRLWQGDPDLDDRIANELAGEDGWDPGPWVTLEPRGIHRRRLILEQLDEEAGRRLAERWDSSLLTEIWPDRKLLTNLSAIGPAPAELHWQVDPSTLGRSVKLSIDGTNIEHRIEETRGRWRLPSGSGFDGQRRLVFAFDATNSEYEMWIDRPVLVSSPPVSRRRVVHELTTELVFPLYKPSTAALTVNVVVYIMRKRDRAELAISVDGGEPTRRTGVPIESLSMADRSYTIDPLGAFDERDRKVSARTPVHFVDLESRLGVALDTMTVQITLGEDVVVGAHEVRVRLLDGGRVWTRAFHRGVGDRSQSTASWTEAVPSQETEP
jgi:hypothetical protein